MKIWTCFFIIFFASIIYSQDTNNSENIVQQQIKAYNAHDLDAFANTHSDSIQAYIFPDIPLGKGKEEQQKVFGELFANAPDVHAEIKNSFTFGEYVINHEVVTDMPDGKAEEAIVIYKVEDNLIRKVWYIYK